MARLSREQKIFLEHHDVPLSLVFDASGLSTPEYKALMKELGLLVAYGVTPCAESGHTLRVRSGHCVQCKPKNLSFIRRYSEHVDVYIAYSASKKLVKVGSSNDPAVRIKNLNSYSYGGASDWFVKESTTTINAGRVEYLVQKELERYRVDGILYFDGRPINSSEIYRCRLDIASNALKAAISKAKNA